jgi:hypothetical protein
MPGLNRQISPYNVNALLACYSVCRERGRQYVIYVFFIFSLGSVDMSQILEAKRTKNNKPNLV